MSQIMMMPIEQLVVTGTNARKDHIADKAMIASIKSQGLLYPLLVEVLENGKYDVVDGARRLTCILDGVASGELPADYFRNVPCILGNGDGRKLGLEQSLHANLHMSMHPLDECEAILTLSKMGEMGNDIGLRFGQDARWVDQRVKLANLCDEVKAIFRDGTIGLAAAMKFTLGSPEKQKAFLKAHFKEGFTVGMIEPAMTDRWINARHVNFDLDDYNGPRESDLFGEDTWLLDRKQVAELQDVWAGEVVAELEKKGYDKVAILAKDDWQTLQGHVEVKGRISKDDRARLKCFLKADNNGLIHVYHDMAPRKAVDDKGKIKPEVHKADSTTPENIKPLLCTELTVAQQEIVNALAASSLYTTVIEGDELLAQYLVVDRVFGPGFWTNGPHNLGTPASQLRWERLNKDYPAEQLINGSELDVVGLDDHKTFTFAVWMAMTADKRKDVFLRACASMIYPPHGQQAVKKEMPELGRYDWFIPCSDFFKRYRTDQLIDYRRRSGDREAGKVAKKKGDHVADCVVAASLPNAFKLGFYPRKILTEPKKAKKMTGGVPDDS